MNPQTHTDVCIRYTMLLLAFIVMVSAAGAVTIAAVLNQPVPEFLIALGILATAGLVRLLIPSLLMI